MDEMVTIIRLTLAAFLLYFGVWKHAHWSVALTLVLLTVSNELVCASLRKLREDVNKLGRG